MARLGHGKGYKYAHEFPGHFVDQQYLPDNLRDRQYYRPSESGLEKDIRRRLAAWWKGIKRYAAPKA